MKICNFFHALTRYVLLLHRMHEMNEWMELQNKRRKLFKSSKKLKKNGFYSINTMCVVCVRNTLALFGKCPWVGEGNRNGLGNEWRKNQSFEEKKTYYLVCCLPAILHAHRTRIHYNTHMLKYGMTGLNRLAQMQCFKPWYRPTTVYKLLEIWM